MKEMYEELDCEIIRFETDDVDTGSGSGSGELN